MKIKEWIDNDEQYEKLKKIKKLFNAQKIVFKEEGSNHKYWNKTADKSK